MSNNKNILNKYTDEQKTRFLLEEKNYDDQEYLDNCWELQIDEILIEHSLVDDLDTFYINKTN